MKDMTHKLMPHVPRWLLRRLAVPSTIVAPGQTYTFAAAILLVDMVGFTSLTERLAARGPRGIEMLERMLGTIFNTLVSTIHSFGGDVFRFSGDAITCMWPVEVPEEAEAQKTTASLACAAALNIRSVMIRFAQVDTFLGPMPLEVRIGIGYGPTTVMIVGDAAQQQLVLTGPAMRAALQAEATASPNQIRLHPSVLEVAEGALTADKGGTLRHLNLLVRPSPFHLPVVDVELLRPFIHPVLVSRELGGLGEFVAEFRPVVSMFIGCEGLAEGNGIGPWLNAWVRAAQATINGFGGWLSHVEMSEDGIVLFAHFGAHLAHEDDEQRAVVCALALREADISNFPHLRSRTGITCGRLFVGIVGDPDRHTYTLVGDEINLASRLMEMAPPGQIIVSARVRNATAGHFVFRDMGSARVRGRRERVPVYTVVGARHREGKITSQYIGCHWGMVDRERELDAIKAVIAEVWSGRGRVLEINGEAGIGKSRLVSKLLHRWTARGGVAIGGACLPFAQDTPCLPWRWIVSAHCGLTGSEDRVVQIDQMTQALARLPPPEDQADYWHLRLPLLAEAMGLEMPDNELTRELQGKARRDNTFDTVKALLQANAAQIPTLVLIEDAHWIDDLSLQLAAFIANGLPTSRLLLILVHRPLPFPPPEPWLMLQVLPHHTSIVPGDLTAEDSRTLIENYLGVTHVPDELADLVFERAQGQPLFTEQIARMFQDVGCVRLEEREGENIVIFNQQLAARTPFPDSVRGVMQVRVDQLEEGNKMTLKVASVIGRWFPHQVLMGIYPVPIESAELHAHLNTSERLGLILLQQLVPEPEYIFKHSITREIVYESLPFAQRRSLHEAVARWYEQRHADNLEPYYSLLIHHYSQAGRRERELHYLLLAADHAMRTYASAEAINYYERALELLDKKQEPVRSAEVLMRLARGARFTGQYDRAWGYFQQALSLYEQMNDAVHAAEACFEIAHSLSARDLHAALLYSLRGIKYLHDHPDAQHQIIIGYINVAQLERNRGNLKEAEEVLQHALDLAKKTNDLDGLWKCHRSLSLHHYSRGEKRKALDAGALAIKYVEEANAPVGHRVIALNNQACFAQETGNLDTAIEMGEKGLALARQAGAISEQVNLASTMAAIYNHVGDWNTAEQVLEEGLRLLERHPHPYHEVALYVEAGHTAYGCGDWQKAREHWTRAEEKSRSGAQQIFAAALRAWLAMARVQQGDLEQAEKWASQSRALAEEREQRGALATGYRAQGMIERAQGAWEASEAAFERALALARELDDPVGTTCTLLEYGLLLLTAGRLKEGQALLREAEVQATAISLHPAAQTARELLRKWLS